jgi:hypothetical protein
VRVPAESIAGRLRAVVRHEWALASASAVGLAVLVIWLLPPYALWLMKGGTGEVKIANPAKTIIGDGGDPTGQAWLVAWNGHAISQEPGRLWDTNAFYPDRWGLAFTDSLLGYAPFGLFGSGPSDAILRYNILFVLAFALCSAGAYFLLRQLGAGRIGAALAGVVFAYAPWRYGHNGHLNILSTGGIVLALAMLARGHGYSFRYGYRPQRVRPGWIVAGWVVAAWQISLGFGVGLPFAYLLLIACLAALAGWFIKGRPRLGRALVLSDLGGGLFFAAVTGYLASVYQTVRDLNPEIERTWDYIDVFSPTWRGLLAAARPSLPWGDFHEPARQAMGNASNEKVLLCGFVLYALAVTGLFVSVWTRLQRILLAAGVVIGLLFTFGTNGPLYRLLYLYLPGFDGVRTPGRLILWPTLFLAILAAGLLTRLSRLAAAATKPEHRRTAARVVAVPLLLVVLFESLPNLEHVELPAAPAALAAAPDPVLVLPSDEGIDLQIELWSTDGFPTLVNGASGITTSGHQAIRDRMQTFPDAESLARLRELKVRSVVVLRDRVAGTPYERVLDAPAIPLEPGLQRFDIDGNVLYILPPG